MTMFQTHNLFKTVIKEAHIMKRKIIILFIDNDLQDGVILLFIFFAMSLDMLTSTVKSL